MEKLAPEHKTQTICLVVIATAIVTYMVYWLRPVLVPFVIALFVVSGVTPILELFEKHLRVNRLVASVIAFVAGLVALGVLAVCLWASVRQIGQQGDAYKQRVGELLESARSWLPPSMLEFVQGDAEEADSVASRDSSADAPIREPNAFAPLGETIDDGNANQPTAPPETEAEILADRDTISDDAANSDDEADPDARESASDGDTLGDSIADDSSVEDTVAETMAAEQLLANTSIREPMQIDSQFSPDYRASFEETAGSLIRVGLMRISAALLEIFSTSVVVLIYVFFILLGSADAPKAYASIQAVDRQVRSYLMMKTIISIFTGVAFGVALAAFGVPMALTFGLLAFLLNYIPNVGPVVASLLPIPFILLGDGSAFWMISAITVTMSIQILSGNVVEPKLMGDTSDLHPVVILLALMFWGMMWGITGMFLATPITAGLKIVLEGNEVSKPMSDLLAGRWGKQDKGVSESGSDYPAA